MAKPVSFLVFAASVILVGINLRPILASIGPLLDAIQAETRLSDVSASLLTTLPVAMMGICLLATSRLRRLLGERWGVVVGIALIFIAALVRFTSPSGVQLLLSAVAGGIGIAVVQALIPITIRRRAGPDAAALMGLYSTSIMGGALIASVTAPWFAKLWGWQVALSIWALPALFGIFGWLANEKQPATTIAPPAASMHRQPRAWALLVFFGLATGAYTLVLAWLPPFFTQLGWTAQASGNILGALTAAEVVAGLAVSASAHRTLDRRLAMFTALFLLLTGMMMLALAPLDFAWPAAICAGLGIGALFPLSLIVSMDHSDSAESAGAIIGFVQGGGYILAATLPFAAGVIRENLSDLTPAWWLMSGICVTLAIIASRFRPGDRVSTGHAIAVPAAAV